METAVNHVAVDLGSKQSQVCVRAADGTVTHEAKVPNARLATTLGAVGPGRVVLEACAEAFAVADLARAAGHEVSIVPAGLARNLGVGQRGVKTDRKDAQNLSMASCRMETLPNVHLPSMRAREVRALLTSRAELVSTRTALVNSVRGWMRTQLIAPLKGTRTRNFPERIREAVVSRPTGMPMHIERLLRVIELLTTQIAAADAELAGIVEADQVCQRLMSVPGVGPVSAATMLASVDDVSRFRTAHAVESYVGLTPGEASSGDKVQRTGITRAGSTRVRAALIQAAWSAWNHRKEDPMVVWAKRIAERRPVQVAIVALARKMVGILFALWRDGTTYDPARTAAPPMPPTKQQ